MLVQREMAELKKKSSDFYLKMKKDEKIRMLEGSLGIYKSECMKMVATLDKLQKSQKSMITQHKFDLREIETWKEEAKKLKFQNVILHNTVNQLKSPQLIDKYEERGRQIAEKEFKRLLASATSKN